MTPPFIVTGGQVTLHLDPGDLGVLQSVPTLLEIGGDAGGRLDYVAYSDDPEAEARYRSLVSGQLAELRAADDDGFARVLQGTPVPAEDLESFMRVVGEARLVLAARLGIEDDGWEVDIDESNPEMALLAWLGYLQDAAVAVLSELL